MARARVGCSAAPVTGSDPAVMAMARALDGCTATPVTGSAAGVIVIV